MREFPFTAEILESLVGRYMLAVWPLPVVAPALALLAALLAFRPSPYGGRAVAAVLAAAWGGVGIDFQIKTAGTIDFLAPAYGVAFLVQSALLIWAGLLRDRLPVGPPRDAAGWLGVAACAMAIAGYPLLALATGKAWPALPVVGVTPDPTVMLTVGLLLAGSARPPLYLLAIPALWALVAGAQGWMLGTPERLVLPLVTAVALVAASRRA